MRKPYQMGLLPRPTWDEYFLDIAQRVATRATCDRGKSGAVIVIERDIVSTGYVGSPPGLPHCDEEGHLMRRVIDDKGDESMHCIRTLHAEENAILQAAKKTSSVRGGTLYCTMTPCFHCAKMIAGAGIKRVVAQRRYHADELSLELFKKAGIECTIMENVFMEYEDQ